MTNEPQYVTHLGVDFENAIKVIERLTLPIVLARIKSGALRVYRIPGVPGKYFRANETH
jgi:hypothetical protein